MTDLTPVAEWPGVRQIEVTDKVLGGPGGIVNVPAQQLLNRTAYLDKYTPSLYRSGETYDLHERVQLSNGEIVKSTIPNNIVDPNADMTGWVNPEAKQREINTFYKGAFQFVDNWGTKGDGVTQDSVSLNNAVNAAHNLYLITGTPVTLLYRDGATYVCHGVSIKEGVNHVCYGTARILKTPALPGELESSLTWRNIFGLAGSDFAASTLRDRVWFSGLIIDGNYNNMNWTFGTYNQQQAASVHLFNTSIPTGKRFKIGFDRMKFVDSVADGLLVSSNIDLKVRSLEGENCFRGGMTFVGGNTLMDVDGYTGNSANFHVEVDGRGNDNSYRVLGNVSNVEIDAVNGRDAVWGGFYFVAGAGTDLTFNNFKCHSKGFGIESTILGNDLTNTTKSKVIFNDSFFTVGHTGDSRYYFPRNVDFNNVEFLYTMPDDATANYAGTYFYWQTSAGTAPVGQVINYNKCKFIGEVKNGFKQTAAFRVDRNPNAAAGVINFNDCESSGMIATLFATSGYKGKVKSCHFDTTNGILVGSSSFYEGCNLDIEMSDLSFGANCTSALRILDQKNDGTSIVKFGANVVANKSQVTTVDTDFTNINGSVVGGMTLLSDVSPNAATNNFDVKYLTGTEWIVTNNLSDGKPKRYKNLGAVGVRDRNGWRAIDNLPKAGVILDRPVLTKFDVGTRYINTETSKIDTWTGTAWI